jgi:photosynthetic reaction center cytochrome c subunit
MKRVLIVAVAVFVGTALVRAQSAPPAPAGDRPPLARDVFKNIQVLKDVPADQFLASMGFIANALAVNCTYCHLGEGGGGWAEYAKDNDKKVMARRMMQMMKGINDMYFGGRSMVTCVSCHNASNRPRTSPNIAAYYGAPTTDEPSEITTAAKGAPTADQVLDKYIQALGGAQKLATLTSFVAKGSDLSYGAPNQLAEVATTESGPRIRIFDGRGGYASAPEAYTPLPRRVLSGGELEGAKLDAMLAFPGQIKQALRNWRGAVPTAIGDTDVEAIEGTMANGFPVKLYFDDATGLLVRQVRYVDAALGRATWQIDYSDYRDVAGVKIPFKRTLLWQSGQSQVVLTEVQPNVTVDPSRFSRP